ncbi:uncharacterized protein LOC124155332 isoform X2 [Ischnura elegans]|nr:uncharacterized protein LOC124155332 isoform X2 [Ischnura elegans]XP_046385037.1 uncharacterized protein LOC124155332 isoform X2 [Ischnura elegans]
MGAMGSVQEGSEGGGSGGGGDGGGEGGGGGAGGRGDASRESSDRREESVEKDEWWMTEQEMPQADSSHCIEAEAHSWVEESERRVVEAEAQLRRVKEDMERQEGEWRTREGEWEEKERLWRREREERDEQIDELRSGEEGRRAEVDVLRARILELEVGKVIGEEPVAGVSIGVQATEGAEEEERLRGRVEEVEAQLEEMRNENARLKEELEHMRNASKKTDIKSSSGVEESQQTEQTDACDFKLITASSKSDDDLRKEYESQIQSIRELRGVYEERMKTSEVQNQKLREAVSDKTRRLELSQRRCSELRSHAGELEALLGEQESVAKGLQVRLSASLEEGRGLAMQLAMVNRLFGRLGDTAELDFERLRLLQNSNEDGSGSEGAGACGGDQEVDKAAKKKAEDLKEIAASLPKVWHLLVELLGEEQKEEEAEEEEARKSSSTDGCFDSVPTPYGPKLVISVSRTFIRLKDLILEKKSLQSELGRIRDLNGRLESKLKQQERRLATVKVELKRTWSLVSKMRAQHRQLHSSEQVLRYELQQKRKLLGELKHELEYCREKWDLARLKNSQSEKEWQLLKQEFRARRSGNGDGRHDSTEMNSPESGFSDGRGEDEEEEDLGDVGGSVTEFSEGERVVVVPEVGVENEGVPLGPVITSVQQAEETQVSIVGDENSSSVVSDECGVQVVNLDILAEGAEKQIGIAYPEDTLMVNGGDAVDCRVDSPFVPASSDDLLPSSSSSGLQQTPAPQSEDNASPAAASTAERSMEERLQARAERLRRLEEQCSQLFKKVTRTTNRSAELSSRLEELHEQYGEQGSGSTGEGGQGSPVLADTETGEAVHTSASLSALSPSSTPVPLPMVCSSPQPPPVPPPLPSVLPVVRIPSVIDCNPPSGSNPSDQLDSSLVEEASAVSTSGDSVEVVQGDKCETSVSNSMPVENLAASDGEPSPMATSSQVAESNAFSVTPEPKDVSAMLVVSDGENEPSPSSTHIVDGDESVNAVLSAPENVEGEIQDPPPASNLSDARVSGPSVPLQPSMGGDAQSEEAHGIPVAVSAPSTQSVLPSEIVFGGILEEEEEDEEGGLMVIGVEDDLGEELDEDLNLDSLEASMGGEESDDSEDNAMEEGEEEEEDDDQAYITRMTSTIYGLHHGPLFDDGRGSSASEEEEEGILPEDDDRRDEDDDDDEDDDLDEEGLSGSAVTNGSIRVASLLLQQFPKRMDILRRERHSLEQRVEEAEAALGRAVARTSAAEQRSRALERGLAQAQERLRVLELEVAVERNKRLLEIKTSLDSAADGHSAQNASESIQQSSTHSSSLQEEIDNLQRQTLAQIAQFKAAAVVSQAQKEQLCTLTEEVERQEKLVNILEGELASLRVERKEQSKALEDASDRLKDALELLSNREEENEAMQQEMDKLRGELKSSTEENGVLSCKLVDAEAEVSRLGKEIEQLKDDSARLQEVVIKLTGEKEDLFRANHRLEEMRRLVLEDSKWVNDSEIETCTACGVTFSLMIRRHHCRSCGKIFCGACSSHWLTLNSGPGSQASSLVAGVVETIMGSGKRSRACAECFAAYAREAAEADSRSSKASCSYTDKNCDSKVGSSDACGSSNSEGLTDPTLPAGAMGGECETRDDDDDEEEDAEDFSMISEEEVFLSQCTPYVPNPVTLQYWKSCEIQSGVTSSGSDLLALSVPDGGEGGKGKTEDVWIRAGAIYSVPLLIEEKNINILWEFSTNPNSIAFSVLYKTSMDVPMSNALIVVPTTRVNSHLTAIHGRLRPKRSGVYILMFDNSFSRFTGKTVSYCLRAETLSKGKSGRDSVTSSSRSSVEPFPDLPNHEEADRDGGGTWESEEQANSNSVRDGGNDEPPRVVEDEG